MKQRVALNLKFGHLICAKMSADENMKIKIMNTVTLVNKATLNEKYVFDFNPSSRIKSAHNIQSHLLYPGMINQCQTNGFFSSIPWSSSILLHPTCMSR